MVDHECPRCGYRTSYKYNLKPHLTTKKICPPHNSDMDRETILANLFPNYHEKENNNIECMTCHKMFKNVNSLGHHQRNSCKGESKIDTATIMKELTKVKKELKELKSKNKSTGNTTINIVQNNTVNNNTVKINAFNDIVPSHIEKDIPFLDKCVSLRDVGVKKLVEVMHFDQKHPENNNVKKKNKKEKYTSVYDGNRWVLERDDQVIKTLVLKSTDTLSSHYRDREDEINHWLNTEKPYLVHYVREFFDTLDDLDSSSKEAADLLCKLREDAKLVLLSNMQQGNINKLTQN